jgi:hypothetical protein
VAEAETFSQAALVETHRRGLERAEAVCAVLDGAEWLQGFVDDHRMDAVRMLDFAHAAAEINQSGQAGAQAGTTLPTTWLTDQVHTLKRVVAIGRPHGPADPERQTPRPGGSDDSAGVWAEAGGSDAVPTLSGTRVADWVRQWRAWAHSRDAGTAHRPWDALGTPPRSSPVDGAQRRMEWPVGRSIRSGDPLARRKAAPTQAGAGNSPAVAGLLARARLGQALQSVGSPARAEGACAE